MLEWIDDIVEALKWVVSIGGALAVIWGWFAKPLRDLKKELVSFESNMKSQMTHLEKNIESVQETTDFLTGDRLAQAHTYWRKKKYCPPADKARLVDMHKIYRDRGLNHLYDNFESELFELPDEPVIKE